MKRLRLRKEKIRREFEKLAADVLFTALVFAIGGMILRNTNTNKPI